MRAVRDHVAQAAKLYYKRQKQAWSLDAIELYGKAVAAIAFCVARLAARLGRSYGFPRLSRGLRGVAAVSRAHADAAALKTALASIRYNLLIGSSSVTVSAYRDEADYGAEIQSDFEKFRQGVAADHVFKFATSRR